MADTGEETAPAQHNVGDDVERSRSPLETVAEEAEGYQPILVRSDTDWKTVQLLVEDSNRASLAPSLELALRHFFASCKKDVSEISRCDLMIVLIYVIALESGLIPAGAALPEICRPDKQHVYRTFDVRVVKHFATRLPMQCFRNSSDCYRLEMAYVHKDAIKRDVNCTIVAVSCAELLIVNLIPSISRSLSTALPVKFHVPMVNSVRMPLCFQFLKEFSLKLKNDLFVPFGAMLHQQCIPIINPSLAGIPQELQEKIVSYLKIGKASKANLLNVFASK